MARDAQSRMTWHPRLLTPVQALSTSVQRWYTSCPWCGPGVWEDLVKGWLTSIAVVVWPLARPVQQQQPAQR
jgi:hypothetical protein